MDTVIDRDKDTIMADMDTVIVQIQIHTYIRI